MYINISRVAGAAAKIGERAAINQQELIPLLKAQPGFLGYAAFASEQGDGISLHIWENADALESSYPEIRDWVKANSPAFSSITERFHGEVGHYAVAEQQSGGLSQSLYCMVRKADSLPSTQDQRPVLEEMLAAARKVPGFRGAYWLRSTDNPTCGASVLLCDNREHANAAHEDALAIMHRHRPQVTVQVVAAGETAVLAMA